MDEDYAFDILHNQQPEQIKIFTMSWNMGNSEAHGLDLVFSERDVVNEFDVIVIGLQESTYVEAHSIDPTACIRSLTSTIAAILGSNYYQVNTIYLAYMLYLVLKLCGCYTRR